MTRLSGVKLAAQIGKSSQHVNAQRRAGKSDAEIIAEATQRNESQSTTAPDAVDAETMAQAQRRKEIAQANLKELEESEKRGQLVDITAAAQAWHDAGTRLRDELMGIPDRVALKLEGKNARQIREVLMSEVRRALLMLSDELRPAA